MKPRHVCCRLSLVAALAFPGCGDGVGGGLPQHIPSPVSTASPAVPTLGAPVIESISPSTVQVGSPDVTITVKGSNFDNGTTTFFSSGVTWTVNENDTFLTTTFVSQTQLTAIIPAGLMATKRTARITVQDWRGADDMPTATSNVVTFTVN